MEEYKKRQIIIDYMNTINNKYPTPISKSEKFSPLGIFWEDEDFNMLEGKHYLENNLNVTVDQMFRDTSYLSLLNLPDTKKELIEYVDDFIYEKIQRLILLMYRTFNYMNPIIIKRRK